MTLRLFETDRLLCRRWRAEDLEPLHAVYSDAEAMRWVGEGRPITRAECEAWLTITEGNYAQRGYGMFALEERASSQVVGFCGLVHPRAQPEPEIKYAFLRSHWGRGLASEMAPALLAYAASAHALLRVIATVAEGNLASQRVLTKAGMALVERRRNDDSSITYVYEWLAPLPHRSPPASPRG